MKYDGRMDPQCIDLCDALNSIPGIRTVNSCCGHNKHSYCIWFNIDRKKVRFLTVVARVFDRRYGGIIGWSCFLDNGDIPKYQPVFRVDSGEIKGRKAYRDSVKIAGNIYGHLKHKAFCKAFLGLKVK